MDRDTRDMLLETADRFFTQRCGRDVVNAVEHGAWPADLWKDIEEMGLPLIAVPEDKGGVGRHLGRHAGAPAAGRLARRARAARRDRARQPPDRRRGRRAQARSGDPGAGQPQLSGGRVSGKVERVPFASVADRFVAVVGGTLAVVAKANARIEARPSHAGEPYGTVTFDNAAAEFSGASPVSAERAFELAAVMRAMQMAGAADKVLATAVEYSKQRVQFGRSISTFQAIQHMLAELASCVAATIASAEAAARDADEGGLVDGGRFSIAAAKSQASDFAQRIAAISHQSMGAMGFTHEHILHHYTRRLWVWRRDFGSETFWGEKIGQAYAKAGPDALWAGLSASKYAA